MSLIKKILKFIFPPYLWGLFQILNSYRIEKNRINHIALKNNNKLKAIINSPNPIQIELGARNQRKGWVTIDIQEGSDMVLDLTKPLPFPSNSIDKIYSSHVFEHFYYPEIIALLKECYRVLKKGSTFSICVPNASIFINAYYNSETFNPKTFCRYRAAYHYYSEIDYINYIAYMDGNHKFMFDKKNLIAILKSIEFEKVELREFNSELDLKERDYESIYALSIK